MTLNSFWPNLDGMLSVIHSLFSLAQKKIRTKRKTYQELEIKDQELSHWKHIFRNAAWGMSLATPDHRVIMVNRAFAEMHGSEVEEWVGRNLAEMFTDEWKAKLPEFTKKVHETGHLIYESMHVRKDGTRFPVLADVTAFKDDEGKVLFRVANFQDLSEKRRSEEALRESEYQFKNFANSMPQLAWKADSQGNIYWFNDRWYEYTGSTPHQMLEKRWQGFHHPDYLPKILKWWDELILKKASSEMQFPLRSADGNYQWFLTRVTPVRNSGGEVTKWFGTCTNIDEQVQLQSELKDAIRARDEFLSIASHELKTPITSLKLQIEMTLRSLQPKENQVPSLEKISKVLSMADRQLVRLQGLVDDLLDVARIRSGKITLYLEEVHLASLIREVIERFDVQLKESNTPVRMDLDENVVGQWDRGRLEQVIVNLISNAIKYAPGTPLEVLVVHHEDIASFRVSDQGPGIPVEKQPTIFERFERAEASKNVTGLGLGLFIVKQIVEAHQGRVELRSESGKGSHFIVKLPLRPSVGHVGLVSAPQPNEVSRKDVKHE